MTELLNSECRKRLQDLLEAGLPAAMVENGNGLLPRDLLPRLADGDTALPTEVREKFAGWVSDCPFSLFVFALLRDQIGERFEPKSQAEVRLVDLPGYTDVSLLAKDLLNSFESLPWRYTLLFPLPLRAYEASDDDTREYPLSTTLSLVAPGKDFSRDFPTDGIESLFDLHGKGQGPLVWLRDRYHVKFEVEGYIGGLLNPRPIEEASLVLRSLSGLLLSSATVRSQFVFPPFAGSPFYIYRLKGAVYERVRSHNLLGEYSEKINRLKWTESTLVRRPEWTRFMLSLQNLLHPALRAGHDKSPLRLAAQWYFDSECGSNTLLQFVQATVALEILLGDKKTSDVIGISKLLANRCAYLLATSPQQRSSIIKEVSKLYDTRSKIVHSGKHRLSKSEFDDFSKLRFYCRRVIFREMELLSNEEGTSATEQGKSAPAEQPDRTGKD